MRKLVVSIHSTANNIVTGPPSGDETDFMQWAHPGIEDSLDRFLESLDGVDTILLGRGTYEDLVRKWPLVGEWPDVSDVALRIGEKINTTQKVVVTGRHPLGTLAWGGFEPPIQITGAAVAEQIEELRRRDGGDIITFGSPVLVQSLTNAGLVDEYRIIVHPVLVNEGRRLFDDLEGRTDLRLVGVDTFAGGAMLVTYAPTRS
ncbi:dihydrofolate reductase family protein [Pseudonocardia kunmingensis]|uniref:Dihydrofolate reductase n=1 Tax=Pseudonocardia kunmingensis TaxID=630975 RepID=A0A543D4M4_9PSEU|nr:dihydrofolate reductase family protein [Pseudonocardia kunmingensis]TQM04297.1 dihydrofolate reductase [Pseudonocardia kunmingensis]